MLSIYHNPAVGSICITQCCQRIGIMASNLVYTGRWTDHSYDAIVGGRVEMSTQSTAVLIAFVVLFDGLVGNIFWNLLAIVKIPMSTRLATV